MTGHRSTTPSAGGRCARRNILFLFIQQPKYGSPFPSPPIGHQPAFTWVPYQEEPHLSQCQHWCHPLPRDATTLVRLPPSPPSSSPFPPTPPVHKQHNTPWSVSSQLAPLQPTNTATLGLPHLPPASRAWADPTISKISKIPFSQRIWCVVVQKTLRGR